MTTTLARMIDRQQLARLALVLAILLSTLLSVAPQPAAASDRSAPVSTGNNSVAQASYNCEIWYSADGVQGCTALYIVNPDTYIDVWPHGYGYNQCYVRYWLPEYDTMTAWQEEHDWYTCNTYDYSPF